MPSPSTAAARSSAAISAASDLSPFAARCWRYEPALDRREVGEHQLELEGVEVGRGVGVAGHRRVFERPQHEEDGVAVAQRAEEPVAEALAGARALHQRGDVDDLEAGVHELLGVRHLAQQVDPLVGHVRDRRPRSRWSRTGAAATTVDAPVSALNRLDLPLLGRPTRPRRSTAPSLPGRRALHGSPVRRSRRQRLSTTLIGFSGGIRMSKKTTKRKLRSRRNKANHGKRPNSGRR